MVIRVTFEHGIVIRKAALRRTRIDREQLLSAFESQAPFSENDDLVVFGPSFGSEACDEFIRRLKDLGLQHVDDFFELEFDHPEWLSFSAQLAKPGPNSQ